MRLNVSFVVLFATALGCGPGSSGTGDGSTGPDASSGDTVAQPSSSSAADTTVGVVPGSDSGSTDSMGTTDGTTGTGSDSSEDGSSSGGMMVEPPPPPKEPSYCGEIAGGMVVGGAPLNALGFPPPCNPRAINDSPDYTCCSDDPAAVGGDLPSYEGMVAAGSMPYFADTYNQFGTSGLCIDRELISDGAGLLAAGVENCPVPCNPTWEASLVAEVCGPVRVCCQTQELQPADCVLDRDTGLWRPARGTDIPALTNWASTSHATHQDANGPGCLAHAGGDNGSPVFNDCVAQLSVADQRGLCMALAPGQLCPHAQPAYIDACEQLNRPR